MTFKPFGLTPAASGLKQEHQQIGRGGLSCLTEVFAETISLMVTDHSVLGVEHAQLLRHARHLLNMAVKVGIRKHGPNS